MDHYLSLASVETLVRENTHLQIAGDIPVVLGIVIEQYITAVALKAQVYARYSGRETIQYGDIVEESKGKPAHLHRNSIKMLVKDVTGDGRMGSDVPKIIGYTAEVFGGNVVKEAEKLCLSDGRKRIQRRDILVGERIATGGEQL